MFWEVTLTSFASMIVPLYISYLRFFVSVVETLGAMRQSSNLKPLRYELFSSEIDSAPSLVKKES